MGVSSQPLKKGDFFFFLQNLSTSLTPNPTSKDPEPTSVSILEVETNKEIQNSTSTDSGPTSAS